MIKLDNPTWHSLNETHKEFGVDYGSIKFYRPEYCPFGGFVNIDETEAGIEQYTSLTNDFYVVGDMPKFNASVRFNKELICVQMVLDNRVNIRISEQIVELTTAMQKSELFNLVNLVFPGYFKIKTSHLGSYYGVYKNNKLIAAAGERMKMAGYTEISSVVTDPEHRGRGYAKQLVAHASNKIFDENRVPYLHAAATNTDSIRLYETLGFKARRKVSFRNFILNS